MRLFSYIVASDFGLLPQPFLGLLHPRRVQAGDPSHGSRSGTGSWAEPEGLREPAGVRHAGVREAPVRCLLRRRPVRGQEAGLHRAGSRVETRRQHLQARARAGRVHAVALEPLQAWMAKTPSPRPGPGRSQRAGVRRLLVLRGIRPASPREPGRPQGRQGAQEPLPARGHRRVPRLHRSLPQGVNGRPTRWRPGTTPGEARPDEDHPQQEGIRLGVRWVPNPILPMGA